METVKTRHGLYRHELVTDDLAEAREFLDQAYRETYGVSPKQTLEYR